MGRGWLLIHLHLPRNRSALLPDRKGPRDERKGMVFMYFMLPAATMLGRVWIREMRLSTEMKEGSNDRVRRQVNGISRPLVK